MGYHTGKFIDGLFQSNDRPVWDMLPGDVAQRLAAGKWRNHDRNERTKGSETPLLARSTMTVKRSLNESEDAGLILRVRQGFGEPNKIYVLIPKKEDSRL